MRQDPISFQPQSIAVLSDGREVIPESVSEETFLKSVAESNHSDEMKDRLATLGSLVNQQNFDIDFNANKRKSLPTELDPQLRQMIRGN